MPDIKLKNGSGVEQTYAGVDTITVPLADGTGNWTFGFTDGELDIPLTEIDYSILPIALIERNKKQVKFYNVQCSKQKTMDSQWRERASNYYIDTLTDVRVEFAPTSSSRGQFDYMFAYYPFEELPKLKFSGDITYNTSYGYYGMESMFYGCSRIKVIPDDLFDSFPLIADGERMGKTTSLFYNCSSLKVLPRWFQKMGGTAIGTSRQNVYNNMFIGCYALEEIINIPVTNYTSTSNMFTSFLRSNIRAKNLTFQTQLDGTPYIRSWKNQTIDLGSGANLGFSVSSSANDITSYSGISADKNVCDQLTSGGTVEGTKARYEQLKNDPDWFSISYTSVTYNGKSGVNLASLFSRYNHDSAVETINSLPDTSEYLATAGGTNTIKFLGISGAETDGGAINTLTEEEIAVAAAKGWTVTLS